MGQSRDLEIRIYARSLLPPRHFLGQAASWLYLRVPENQLATLEPQFRRSTRTPFSSTKYTGLYRLENENHCSLTNLQHPLTNKNLNFSVSSNPHHQTQNYFNERPEILFCRQCHCTGEMKRKNRRY